MRVLPAIAVLLFLPACSPSSDLIDHNAVFAGYDWWDSRDFDWYEARIPFVETPDDQINEVYYYRWEVMKTHLTYGSPETGYLFTEFMDRPFWSGTFGGISCPLGHQLTEVRWLKDARIVDDFARYWIDTDGAKERNYSNWYGSALKLIHDVWGDDAWFAGMLPYMEEQYKGWLETNWDPEHGMFFKTGHDDGMEININSRQTTDDWVVEGYRPTLNAYLYGDLHAMAHAASLAGDDAKVAEYTRLAEALKQRVIEELWDPDRDFFFHQFKGDHPPGITDKSLTYETGPYAGHPNGRELIGYVPWQFNLPDDEHSSAWQFLMDERHFKAEYGPTTVSRSDTLFQVFDACCRWSGNSWPYATTQTLVALANLLNNYEQDFVDVDDYVELMRTYTRTQYKDGRPYIAEVANPFTGSWFGGDRPNHSEHYSHSGYVDLVLGGPLGIRPQADGTLVVNPLVPADWDYFAAEGLRIHGHNVDVIWDRDGSKYGRGAGLQVRVTNPATGGLENVGERKVLGRRDDVGRLQVALERNTHTFAFDRPHNLAVNNGRAFPEISASFEHPEFPAPYANDGAVFYHKVPTTRFTTEGSPNESDWLAVDFGGPQTVGSVHVHFLDDGDGNIVGDGDGDTNGNRNGVVPPEAYQVELLRDGEWVIANEESRSPRMPTGRMANVVELGSVTAEGVRVTFDHAQDRRTGLAELEVWTPAETDVAPPVREPSNFAVSADGAAWPRISGSFPDDFDWGLLNDGIAGLMTYQYNRWIPRNTPNDVDWVQIEFEYPKAISAAEVFLFGRGARYLAQRDTTVIEPTSLGVEVLADGEWVPVSGLSSFPDVPAVMARNLLTFDAVETSAVRVLFEHAKPAVSAATEIRIY